MFSIIPSDANDPQALSILGQVWYLIVSIPDLCSLSYFDASLSTKQTKKQTQGPQPSEAGEAQTCSPSVASQALYY